MMVDSLINYHQIEAVLDSVVKFKNTHTFIKEHNKTKTRKK